jgi:hypothetical protein
MFCAADRVSLGVPPPGGVAVSNSLPHASGKLVTQADSRMPSVLNLASVVVCELLSGSWITGPRPPVSRSTKFGTLPAAIRSPSAWPRSAAPFTNCAAVHAEATVVSSLIVTRCGGSVPNRAIKAIAGFGPLPAPAFASPPLAMR